MTGLQDRRRFISDARTEERSRDVDQSNGYYDLNVAQLVIFALVGPVFVVALYILQQHAPVTYVFLLLEDSLVEYATFTGFAVTAFILGRLAFQPGPWYSRIIWALVAIVAAVVAMEEISWAQRIIGLDTPELFVEINEQDELTLHNIEGMKSWTWKLWLAGALIAWTLISMAVLMARRRFRISSISDVLPIFPARLWVLSLFTAWIILQRPAFVRIGEVQEFLIALLAVVWASDLYDYKSRRPMQVVERLFRSKLGIFGIVFITAVAFTAAFPGYARFGLNEAAAKEFPESGLLAQSREVFEYILSNPNYVNDNTLTIYREMFPGGDLQSSEKNDPQPN